MHAATSAHRRFGRSLLALALSGALLVTPGLFEGTAEAAPTKKERKMFRMVNRARVNRGLPRLRLNRNLTRKAHRHSVRMARRRRVYHHSCLSCIAPRRNWRTMGENVGSGRWLRGVHRTFMRSPRHRRNILCRCHRGVGVGVVRRAGRLYVTQIFIG